MYFYKFIVDGTWAVDPFAPKATDNYGNYNNLCEVRGEVRGHALHVALRR